ncbi:TolC family protein [Arenimonas sp.]|uniref:TolC family protein n=1 Tax=Arenimonas sp. TaxID=1872635 RepID=UPI0035AFA504
MTLAILFSAQPLALAKTPVPGADLASVRTWLLTHNPDLQAMQADAEAAQARIHPAGAMPDPRVEIRLQRMGDTGSAFYGVKQPIPLWGKRGLARDIARRQADAAGLEREAAALDLLARAEQAYVRFWHAGTGVEVLDRQVRLLAQMEEIARLRYSLGVAAQQDSIRAQVARTTLQAERIRRLAVRDEAMAALNAALGRQADARLAEPADEPVLALPTASLGDALGLLAMSRHPALEASTAMAGAADIAALLQRRQRFPDLTLGVGRMRRDDQADANEIMFEVEIPLQQRARREREREARQMAVAARARTEALETALQGQLGQAWAQAGSARERRQLIEQTLLPQAQANFESALASYRVGEVDFGTLLEALDGWLGADLARADARRDELIGAAAVRALLGSVE